MRALSAVSAKRVIHAMGEDHAETACKGNSDFAPVRWEHVSKVCAGADQHEPEKCGSEHTFFSMFPVSKTDCCRADDRHKDGEQPMGMFFRRKEMGRDGGQREDYRSRDAMNKTQRRSGHPRSV
jgi:hypothetical protein